MPRHGNHRAWRAMPSAPCSSGCSRTYWCRPMPKKFAEYAGERFQVSGSQANDDDSITVNSLINRPNGDVVRLDWRVVDAGGLKISDLIVEGVSLRTTYRSDVASVIQNNGGKVADLIDELRQKTGSQ